LDVAVPGTTRRFVRAPRASSHSRRPPRKKIERKLLHHLDLAGRAAADPPTVRKKARLFGQQAFACRRRIPGTARRCKMMNPDRLGWSLKRKRRLPSCVGSRGAAKPRGLCRGQEGDLGQENCCRTPPTPALTDRDMRRACSLTFGARPKGEGAASTLAGIMHVTRSVPEGSRNVSHRRSSVGGSGPGGGKVTCMGRGGTLAPPPPTADPHILAIVAAAPRRRLGDTSFQRP